MGSMGPMGDIPPARSALTVRIVLATFGFMVCAIGAIMFKRAGVPPALTAALGALAVVALVDIVVVARRKYHGERG
jgi:hypothetical protein